MRPAPRPGSVGERVRGGEAEPEEGKGEGVEAEADDSEGEAKGSEEERKGEEKGGGEEAELCGGWLRAAAADACDECDGCDGCDESLGRVGGGVSDCGC